jgi:hypothetical protein
LNRLAVAQAYNRSPPDFHLGEYKMAISDMGKHNDYARFAAYCLDLDARPTATIPHPIQREMALEWLKLAEAALHPHAA